LKLNPLHLNNTYYAVNCKAHPDEKGIETKVECFRAHDHRTGIARPIPTKRELKLIVGSLFFERRYNCKAHPDEKGIETNLSVSGATKKDVYCKAHPDEKGIETVLAGHHKVAGRRNCKAHPDEKGIETAIISA